MKLARYDDDRLGIVDGETVIDVSPALERLAPIRWPAPLGDRLIAELDRIRPALERAAGEGSRRPVSEVALLSPVANPAKIIGAPVNYTRHREEAQADEGIHHGRNVRSIGEIGLFLKATSSVIGPSEGVALRFTDRRNDHEVELAVVIGGIADRVPRDRALDYVAGYAIGLDMTVRGNEARSFRKSIDTYSVIGPWLVTAEEIVDPGELDLELSVNGEVRQRSNTRYLDFDVPRLIEFASSQYTLHPGDVILTGTPEGVGPVEPGDRMVARIQGIGAMTVDVRAA